jgi:hypothetical protein
MSADVAPAVRALGSLALPFGLLVLLGPYAPLDWGLAWPLMGVVGMAVLAIAYRRGVQAWVRHRGGWSAALAELTPLQRTMILVWVGLPTIVLFTVAARATGALLVAFPASVWALGVVALGAPVVARVRGRARLPVALALAVAVPAAGVFGARYEAQVDDARGWAHSGPIHGTHPFQTTAVLVDGYGPFDVPFNDYVEPDGSRGYGPQAFADALERALHEIARVHFAQGPHRARLAFAEATVEARTDPAIRERLDREPTEAEHPRVFVQSGTWGQRSRVEFVCPGRRDEPGGAPPDNVMNKMCPDKYASEASAGLGVTGRWPGYAEGRGNERFGLSALFGWTRSDDPPGRAVIEREVRSGGWIVLFLVAMWTLVGARHRDRSRTGALDAVTAVAVTGGVVAVLGSLVLVLLAGGAVSPHVQLFERPPSWVEAGSVRSWLPVLALGGALWWFHDEPGRGRGVRLGVAGPALALGVSIVVVAGHLDAIQWIRPRLWSGEGELALESWVVAVADAVGPRAGLDILAVESALAAMLVAVLVGACAALASAMGRVGSHLRPTPRRRLAAWPVLSCLLLAAALVVSRKTEGASTLLAGAITTSVLLGSSLALVARARARAAMPAGRAGLLLGLAVVAHFGWIALAIAGVLGAASAGPQVHPFVLLATGIGLLVALGGLAFVPWRAGSSRGPRSGDPA